MSRLKRPIDQLALQNADDQFYAAHPHLVKEGCRQPIDMESPLHADYRTEWEELYVTCGGKREDEELHCNSIDALQSCPGPTLMEVTVIECATGKPIPKATVRIDGVDSRSDSTNFAGKVTFLGIAPGTYDVVATDSKRRTTGLVNVLFGEFSKKELCLSEKHWMHFKYVIAGKHFPISDDVKWKLVYPSGVEEEGLLQDGKLHRDNVEPGIYELKFKHLKTIDWVTDSGIFGDPVEVVVHGENFIDGERITIKVFRQFQSVDSPPLSTLVANFDGNRATAKWTHIQKMGEFPFGEFVALAEYQSKSCHSLTLKLARRPLDDKGIQQRLKFLKFYEGAIDGIIGPQSSGAILKFQETFPPLVVDGIAGPKTCAMMTAVLF